MTARRPRLTAVSCRHPSWALLPWTGHCPLGCVSSLSCLSSVCRDSLTAGPWPSTAGISQDPVPGPPSPALLRPDDLLLPASHGQLTHSHCQGPALLRAPDPGALTALRPLFSDVSKYTKLSTCPSEPLMPPPPSLACPPWPQCLTHFPVSEPGEGDPDCSVTPPAPPQGNPSPSPEDFTS